MCDFDYWFLPAESTPVGWRDMTLMTITYLSICIAMASVKRYIYIHIHTYGCIAGIVISQSLRIPCGHATHYKSLWKRFDHHPKVLSFIWKPWWIPLNMAENLWFTQVLSMAHLRVIEPATSHQGLPPPRLPNARVEPVRNGKSTRNSTMIFPCKFWFWFAQGIFHCHV